MQKDGGRPGRQLCLHLRVSSPDDGNLRHLLMRQPTQRNQTMKKRFSLLLQDFQACDISQPVLPLGPRPVLQIHPKAVILVVGQTHGRIVHETGVPFNYSSGDRRTGSGTPQTGAGAHLTVPYNPVPKFRQRPEVPHPSFPQQGCAARTYAKIRRNQEDHDLPPGRRTSSPLHQTGCLTPGYVNLSRHGVQSPKDEFLEGTGGRSVKFKKLIRELRIPSSRGGYQTHARIGHNEYSLILP